MKNSIYLFAIIVFSTLILSNTPVTEVKQFVMTVVGDEPVLPDVPYLYNEVEIPTHLSDNDGSLGFEDTIGYQTGGIDTTVFPLINNDAATLGRVLFYDMTLSSTQDISCGSCHLQSRSFADNADLSDGTNMATMRNSMHLNDLGWSNNKEFGWDVSHENLESILEVPFMDENELGINASDLIVKLNTSIFYPALFEKAYGTQNIEISMVITALADFIKSMTTFNSKLDESLNNESVSLTQSEAIGSAIFSANCSICHFQGEFFFPDLPSTLFEFFPGFFNNGLSINNGDFGAGNWNSELAGLFKAPSLRNIEVTAPYMHDGRFETLDEVIEHYSTGIQANVWSNDMPGLSNFQFNSIEKENLKAFLLTLTDESFLTNPKWSDPFATPLSTSNNSLTIESVLLKPNPMSDMATISFNNDTNEVVTITVHSNDGKLIQQDQIRSNEYVIEKRNFVAGIYYIKLVMGDKMSTQKLIVQ